MDLADCYRLLGLRTGASYEEIKASYRRLARQYHPDANPENQQQAKEKFIRLTDAYRLLISIVPPSEEVKPKSAPAVNFKSDRSRSAPATNSAAANPFSAQKDVSKTAAQSTARKTPPEPKEARKPPSVQTNPDLSATEQQLKQSSYEQLQQFLRERRFPRAIALVEGLARRLATDTEVRQWQAITYQRFGRYLIDNQEPDKAKIYLNKALRTDPHNRSLWNAVEREFRRITQVEIL
jgi:curved DNA-binding protein CbpA